MLAQTRVLGAPSVPVPVVQSRQPRPVQTHCLKRPAPSVSVEDDEDDPLESLLNGGSGQGPPRKRERLNHLTAEQKLDRRKLKNRVAAQTARDRKKARSQRLEEVVRQLMDENARLREENSRLRVIEQQKILEPAVESAEGAGRLHSSVAHPTPPLDLIPQDALNRLFQDLQDDFDLDQLASELPFDESTEVEEDLSLQEPPFAPSQMGCTVIPQSSSQVPASPTSSYSSRPSPIPVDDWMTTTEIKDEDPLLSSGQSFEIDHEESVWTDGCCYSDANYLEEFYSPF